MGSVEQVEKNRRYLFILLSVLDGLLIRSKHAAASSKVDSDSDSDSDISC